MKQSVQYKKKSSSSSRSKNYNGDSSGVRKSQQLVNPSYQLKNLKESSDLQNSGITNYQGGKFLRGRKYSFPFHQNEKNKINDHSKGNGQAQLKKINGINNMNIAMLNINGDAMSPAYEDLLNYNAANNKFGIIKPSSSNSRQNVAKYPTQSKKK